MISAPPVQQTAEPLSVPAPVSPVPLTPVPATPGSVPESAAPAGTPSGSAPASSIPAAAGSSLPQISSAYVIGPEDNIQVTVWKEPNLSSPLAVRPDGMISLPLVGDVAAAGLTPMALGSDLATRLKKYINDPLVTVTVLAVNSKRVFMIGEVGRVGPLAITPGLTVLQAIATAGGLGQYANAKHIYILRGQVPNRQKIPFNYKKAVKDGDQQGITLQPGDTIVVP